MKPLASHTDERLTWSLKLSDDELKLFLDCKFLVTESLPAYEELFAMLAPHISIAQLDEAVLRDIVKLLHEGRSCEERRIAKGEEPSPGRDGKLVWLVKRFSQSGEMQADEKGFVDFLTLNRFDNITKGQSIARLYPPHDGKDGVNAVGKHMKSLPGKPLKLSLDRSVKIEKHSSGAYEVLIAEENGYALEESGRISIRTVLEVKGDVDLKIGSLDFIGGIVISGDVQKGIMIKSQEDLLIGGNVQGENMLSSQKSLTVKGAHFGGERSGIFARDFYKVKLARLVSADVDGVVIVEKEAIECLISTRTFFDARSAKIIGGSYRVVTGAEIGQFGNDAGKHTEVVLCAEIEASREWVDLERSLQQHSEAIELLKLHLGHYAHQSKKIARLAPEHREKMMRLQTKLESLESSYLYQKKKKSEFVAKAKDAVPGHVNITTLMHAGAVVKYGEHVFQVQESMKGPFSIMYDPESKNLVKKDFVAFSEEMRDVTKQK